MCRVFVVDPLLVQFQRGTKQENHHICIFNIYIYDLYTYIYIYSSIYLFIYLFISRGIRPQTHDAPKKPRFLRGPSPKPPHFHRPVLPLLRVERHLGQDSEAGGRQAEIRQPLHQHLGALVLHEAVLSSHSFCLVSTEGCSGGCFGGQLGLILSGFNGRRFANLGGSILGDWGVGSQPRVFRAPAEIDLRSIGLIGAAFKEADFFHLAWSHGIWKSS